MTRPRRWPPCGAAHRGSIPPGPRTRFQPSCFTETETRLWPSATAPPSSTGRYPTRSAMWGRCKKRYEKVDPGTGGPTRRPRTVRPEPLRSLNIGCSMAPAMHGPEDSPRGPSPTHRDRMPRRRWFDFFWAVGRAADVENALLSALDRERDAHAAADT